MASFCLSYTFGEKPRSLSIAPAPHTLRERPCVCRSGITLQRRQSSGSRWLCGFTARELVLNRRKYDARRLPSCRTQWRMVVFRFPEPFGPVVTGSEWESGATYHPSSSYTKDCCCCSNAILDVSGTRKQQKERGRSHARRRHNNVTKPWEMADGSNMSVGKGSLDPAMWRAIGVRVPHTTALVAAHSLNKPSPSAMIGSESWPHRKRLVRRRVDD